MSLLLLSTVWLTIARLIHQFILTLLSSSAVMTEILPTIMQVFLHPTTALFPPLVIMVTTTTVTTHQVHSCTAKPAITTLESMEQRLTPQQSVFLLTKLQHLLSTSLLPRKPQRLK